MIPKIIHQIWIQGYENIPPKQKIYHDWCKIINNDFEHILWDEIKIKKLLMDHFGKNYVDLYDKYTIYVQKSDFARYAILDIYGGIYLDMDMVCRKNMSPFLQYDFFCTTDTVSIFIKRYLNGILGTKPKHPIFQYIFKNIFNRQANINKNLYVGHTTGTKLLYDSISEYQKTTRNNDFSIIDRKYLHPCGPFNRETCPYTCEDCFVAQASASDSSWAPSSIKILNKYLRNIIFIIVLICLLLFFCYGIHRK